MRVSILALGAALALAGCNGADQTADQVENAASRAGDTIGQAADSLANSAEDAGAAIENGARRIGNAIDDVNAYDDWVGRWTGVEGTYLVVSKAAGDGKYRLEMQYTLDDKGTFDGVATEGGITFTRPDGSYTLHATNGDATGLKYLAGKQDCLTVKTGEGYCRD